ncbi:MAG: carbamoyltransferase HypF [Burkholderiales bacterium]|nr:carbamoyltransferase HypF [Burkholderiales bacterium]
MTTSVLAVGAWLKNAACLVLDGQAHWSPVHGDLGDPDACQALEDSVQALLRQAEAAGGPVQAVAHDLHPDFFSTRLAVEQASLLGVPAFGVQHHQAHIAAVLAEHGLDEPVIGLALDGVGLGTDGGAWGGELLWLHGARWQRLGHLHQLALPGGDRAAREPWRMAASALHALGRGAEIAPRFAPAVGEALASGVMQMLERGLNCPHTSSTGRWFDAAAGALDLCLRQSEEAEAAIALETAAARWLEQHPDNAPLPGALIDDHNRLDLRGLLPALLDANTADVDAAAAGFHLALAVALATWVIRAANAHHCHTVCLGGGCFFNRILRERLVMRLEAAGVRVLRPADKGCGDAGLALGQAWVAAQQLRADPAKHSLKETEPCA